MLLVSLFLAVSLSVALWAIGAVPFDYKTFSLYIASIYIGIAGVLIYQRHNPQG